MEITLILAMLDWNKIEAECNNDKVKLQRVNELHNEVEKLLKFS